jgi:hypothetical protein
MRHVPFNRLLKDEDGNVIGFLAQAFEPRDGENNSLSVNWIEYFKAGGHKKNKRASIDKFRRTRNIGKLSAFALGEVQEILETCKKYDAEKVRIVHSPSKINKSHSRIIRIPPNDLNLLDALAAEAFRDLIPNSGS